jgi:hypothetical protein
MRKSVVGLTASAAIILGAALAASTASRAESVMSACAGQWKQAQAAGTTGGQSWPQFLAQCKTRQTAAIQPSSATTAPGSAPAASDSPFPWWQPATPAQTTAPAPTGAGQFSTEAEARYRCPTDKVVWVNTKSHTYHYQGTHNYGHTKAGAYMCEADARAAGDRAARTTINTRHTG